MKGRKILLRARDIPCNPLYVESMTEEELNAEHARRCTRDPGGTGLFPNTYVYHDQVSWRDELVSLWGKLWGAQGIGTLREVLLTPPSENEMRAVDWWYNESGAYQWKSGKPDFTRWLAQYDGLVQAYQQNGIVVHEFETPSRLLGPYGFVRFAWAATDVAIVLNDGAVLPRDGYFGRTKGKCTLHQKVLAELNVPIIYQVRGTGVAEIGGCLWLDDQHFIVEDGTTMNREGVDQLRPVFAASDAKLIVMHTVGHYSDMRFPAGGTSHPDMIIGIPDIGLAVLAPYLCSYSFIKFLKRIDFDIIEVSPEEYTSGVYNMVTLSPGKILCPEGAPKTVKAMRRWGIDVTEIPFDEYMRFNGGPHCATCQLIRDAGPLVPKLQDVPLEELAPELL